MLRLSRIACHCYAILGLGAAPFFVNAGEINGQLTNDDNSRVFAGAQIRLQELNLTTTSGRDGSFRFPSLPAGTYTLKASYLGAAPVTQLVTLTDDQTVTPVITLSENTNSLTDILVRGQRSGQASAINKQRVSSRISSIVSADAIGQFPDQNAAEALQRLPGISLERDQGEGRFVGIRGIDPNLNNVTINGLNIPSPESGVRSVALDVIPSELIQTLEVSKSVTPDMDADAIGGAIDVKSVSAFDYPGSTASVTAQASQNQLVDKTSPKLSAKMTKKFSDSVGIAAALSWFDRDLGSDNIESNGEDELEQREYNINRERLGDAVNLDWRPDFNNQYFLRTLYSQFADDEYRQANIYSFEGEDSQIERESKDRYEEQSIFTVSGGGEHQLGVWLINWQLGYAKSDEDEPDALYYVFKTDNDSITTDLNTQIPIVTQNAAATDLSTYETDEVSFEDNYTKDTETSIKIDVIRPLVIAGVETELKFGSKYRMREKNRDSQVFIYDDGFSDMSAQQYATGSPDWQFGDFGPGLDRQGMRTDFNSNRQQLSLAALDSEVESNGASYVNNEDIFAAYGMLTAQFEKLQIVAGLRYEHTDFSTAGMRVELVENEQTGEEGVRNTPWSTQRDYDYLLPSINLRYDLTDKVLLRGAYTQTLARPKFEDVAAFQIIQSSTEEDEGAFVTEREAEVGNPDLQPYESSNFDLSIEYYPGAVGVLSAGYFYKDIDNFVVFADVAGTSEWEGFDEVIQPVNGESASLQGVELSWVKTFNNGLLLSANGTITDSEATTLLDGESFKTRLPNQSDKIGNLAVGYENNTVSLRLTLAYKSDNFEELDGEMLRIEDSHQQLDFTGKYYFDDSMMVYFNGVNLTNEPYYHYFDQPDRNAQYEKYGRTFEVGFTWRM